MIPNEYPTLDYGLGEDADMLRQSVSGFAADEIAPRAADIDRDNDFPKDLWRKMGDMGLLGITVEGQTTFKIVESWREENNLCRGEVVLREQDSQDAEPVDVGEQFQEYVDLLQGLARHPAIEELKLDISFDNLREIAWRLSELLPIGNREKQALLELTDPFDRLEQIEIYINSINQQENGGL